MENGNDQRKMQKIVASIQKSVDELMRQNAEHLKFRSYYAREMVELIKERQINVGPGQGRLQTLPYATGKEKTAEDRAKKMKRKRKK